MSIERKPSTPSKRSKVDPEHHTYPPLVLEADDETAYKCNVTLLKQECTKGRPNVDNVTSSMT